MTPEVPSGNWGSASLAADFSRKPIQEQQIDRLKRILAISAHQYRFGSFFWKGRLGCCAFEQPVRYNDLYARECDIWWSLSGTAAQVERSR
jgi:hypothetical protein